jgi:hypothetical protein
MSLERGEADRLVDRLAHSHERESARRRLLRLGDKALPALRAGLRHGDWRVRMWCALELDHRSDTAARAQGTTVLPGCRAQRYANPFAREFRRRELVSCPGSSLTKMRERFEDLICGFGPDEGLGIFVVDLQIAVDGLL